VRYHHDPETEPNEEHVFCEIGLYFDGRKLDFDFLSIMTSAAGSLFRARFWMLV